MRIDFHVHSYYSRDAISSPEAIIAACRARALDKIALTDHNTIRGALRLRELAPDLIIVGEEIRTTAGELLALFVEEEVPPDLSPQETLRRLRQQGAIVGVSHPLDRLRREAMGRSNLMPIIEQVDFLEIYNSRCLLAADNRRAAELAAARHLPGTAGSDAHNPSHIGRAYVEMPAFVGREDFLASLRQGRVVGRPSGIAIHFISTYAKLRRRLAGKRRS